MDTATQFKGFAVVELFGHNKISGFVETQTFGSSVFFRVDVPETKGAPAFTRLFNPSAIYAINPCDEQVAIIVANSLKEKPIQSWELDRVLQKKMDVMVSELPEGESVDSDEDIF